jgi:hypothetical protein
MVEVTLEGDYEVKRDGEYICLTVGSVKLRATQQEWEKLYSRVLIEVIDNALLRSISKYLTE